MAPVTRKPATPVAPRGGSVNIGDDALYSGGGQFDLPPGKYALECAVILFVSDKGKEFLAVNTTFHPLDGGEPIVKPLSYGQKAHLSFTPSADGLGLEPIPNAKATTMPTISNWGIFRKSLLEAGLPPGYLSNDVSVLNGTWVVTDNQENEERKKLKDKAPRSGEASGDPQAQRQFDDKQVVVIEILEGGRPWDGTGGFEFPAETPAATPAKKTAPATAPRPAARGPVPVPPPAAEEASEEGLDVVVQAGMTDLLAQDKYVPGCTKLQMRAAVFSHVKSTMGDDSAQEAAVTYFGPGTDAALNELLAPLGYKVLGGNIKQA